MIAYIQGKLAYKDPTYVIIDVGGVGYHIRISLHTFSEIKDEENLKLFTYLQIKEDAHILFGFKQLSEKQLFVNLISISGISGSLGLMILSSLNPDEIQEAIVNEDVRTIQAIKGIGAKTAQRIILELKDKIRKDLAVEKGSNIYLKPHNTTKNEALSALVTLGITKVAAEKSLDNIIKKEGNDITLEQLIKLALKSS
ncbi:MAG: Holliday junction branch migration protein RuvA [Bacteroidota bacterium]|jgi:Holliday junction DNA helicase RuvA|nr:Holliday junction branch migration protein RuvA [Bacteroidota bacterium]